MAYNWITLCHNAGWPVDHGRTDVELAFALRRKGHRVSLRAIKDARVQSSKPAPGSMTIRVPGLTTVVARFMAEAGKELKAMGKEMLEWAAEAHTDTCPLYQEHPADDASCDCLLGDMRRVLTAYEEASK